MTTHYDTIIIGGGHNGLTTAAYLAQAGQRVLVLERRDVLGGAAATEEIFPGFHVNTGAPEATLFDDAIVGDLFLKMHGLAFRDAPVALFAPQPDGRALTLWPDADKSAAAIAPFSHGDAERYPAFVAEVDQMAGLLRRMMRLPPPDLAGRQTGDLVGWGQIGLRLRGLGEAEMMAFLRVLPMPASEFLGEWFKSDALCGALATLSVTGTMLGPRGAGTTLMLLYQSGGRFPRSRIVLGGVGRLSAALAGAAQAQGAEIRTGTAVARILVEDGRAVGVETAAGEAITADIVASSADPRRSLLGLVGPQSLPPTAMRAAGNIVYRGSTARLNLALADLPQFRGQTEADQLSGRILLSPSLDAVERAYDDAKYGRPSTQPILDISIPTVMDPTLAPDGHHIMTVTVRYAPYHLRDGDWTTVGPALADRVIARLADYAPGLERLILHRQLITPFDYEQVYALTEGSIFQGQMGLDQLLIMRPIPGWARYATPVKGLYLCGAGTHPGGGLTGAPGRNAARAILRR